MPVQPPPDPCRHCSSSSCCTFRGLVNRIAFEAWTEDVPFECPDKVDEFHRGIEGVYA